MGPDDVWAGSETRYAWACHACGVRTPRGPLAQHRDGCAHTWPPPPGPPPEAP